MLLLCLEKKVEFNKERTNKISLNKVSTQLNKWCKQKFVIKRICKQILVLASNNSGKGISNQLKNKFLLKKERY